MSKKYVPSFLRDQQSNSTPTTNTNTSFWPGQNNSTSSNKFSALSDDFPMTKNEKPIINTSLPARLAPKLVPATLASITSNGTVPVVSSGNGGPKKSFATKFAEQARIAQDPNYVPPPKPVDLKSEEDFPSLGAPKKPPTTGAWGAKPTTNAVVEPTKPAGASFAEKAKEWANKKAEDEEKARKRALRQERLRREAELIRSMPIMGFRRRQEVDEEDDEDLFNPHYEDGSSLGDDSYEIPSEDDEVPEDDEDNEENEFNQNVGWDGRRRDDLY
jgi:hypothetical protein